MSGYLLASITIALTFLFILAYTVFAIKNEALIEYADGTFQCERVK